MNYLEYYDYSDELYHYGRKGMKWYQHIFGDKSGKNTTYSGRMSAKQRAKYAKNRVDNSDNALYEEFQAQGKNERKQLYTNTGRVASSVGLLIGTFSAMPITSLAGSVALGTMAVATGAVGAMAASHYRKQGENIAKNIQAIESEMTQRQNR